MKFSRELEHAALETVKTAIIGKDIEQEDSHTHEKTTFRIISAKPDRYNLEPCLMIAALPLGCDTTEEEDGEKVELVLRIGYLEY